MELVNHFQKEILFTIVLDYKKNNYIYQFWARNEIEAKLYWAKNIDLNKIGVDNAEIIRKQLIEDALDKDFYPSSLENLQSVWDASACACSFGDKKNFAVANIVATIPSNECISVINQQSTYYHREKTFFNFFKKKILYTIQLDYKGGTYVDQVIANTPVDAKIKWLKQLDYNVVYGVPKNKEETINDILLQKNEPSFVPEELKEFDSVSSTNVQLGDEIGRVTIVATKFDISDVR